MKKFIVLMSAVALSVSVFGMAKAPEKETACSKDAVVKEACCAKDSATCTEEQKADCKTDPATCDAKKAACSVKTDAEKAACEAKESADKKISCGGCPLSK